MGRYDFRPARVHEQASLLLKSGRIKQQPPWFQIIGDVPPAQSIVRPLPIQHPGRNSRKSRKPSRMFQPQRITYKEDSLRRVFFGDHPWELARPRVLLEDDGKDYEKNDWSQAYQAGRRADGEGVVQRQRWLMTEGGVKRAAAYDRARKEFYEERHFDEVERRVAREEAMSTGAYFGKNALQIGMELESQTFEKWKVWAHQRVALQEQAKLAAYTGLGAQSVAEDETGSEEITTLDNITNVIDRGIQDSKGN